MQKYSSKTIARTVGWLYIIGTVAGIASVTLGGSIIRSDVYLTQAAANNTSVHVGAILILVMGFTLAMIPVILYPVFKKYDQVLAMGAVLFRGALEAMAYIAVAVTWIAIVALANEDTSASAAGSVLQNMELSFSYMVSFVFSIGALMIYWLFYLSRLIPRWLAAWGIIGGLLYFIVPVLNIIGTDVAILALPLAVQEMFLAAWLIVKGFSHDPTL